jgi:hypothetical protein
MPRRVEIVGRMWNAYRQSGLEAILDFAAPDAEWRPYTAGGQVFRTTEEYRRYLEGMELRDEIVEATLLVVEALGEDEVLGTGRVRARRGGALEDTQMYWRHRFRGDAIVFTASGPRREDLFS